MRPEVLEVVRRGLASMVLCAGTGLAQGQVRAVALFPVDPVPGLANPLTRFANSASGPVVINNAGAIAFVSTFATPGGGPAGSGIWSDGSGALSPLAFQGDVAPGTQGPTAGDTFMSFAGIRITLSDNNRVAFVQQLTGPFSPWGCWQYDGSTLQLIGLTGQPAPSTPPGLWSITGDARVNQANNGIVALRSGFAVGNGTYQSVHTGGPLSMQLCVRNELATDTSGLTGIGETLISQRNLLCFAAPYRNIVQGVTRAGIWTGPCSGANNVVSHALEIPTYIGFPPFTLFSSPNAFDYAGTGGQAFSSGISGTGTTSANDTAIWVADPSGYRLLAREGDQVPGLPAGCFFSDFFSGTLTGPFISGNQHVAFACNIYGPGVPSDTGRIIVVWEGGPVRVIARTGSQMPGYPNGINYLSFGANTLAINSLGDVVYSANTFAAPPGRGGQAVYMCLAGSTPEILVETNQAYEVRPGLVARFSSLGEPLGSGGDDGLPRNWNDVRQYAFKAGWQDVANFQNAGNGIFVASGPSVCPPCAADYDQDGGVTGGDLGAFFSDFEQGLPCADVDLDGGVTGGDLGAFFQVFEAGGC